MPILQTSPGSMQYQAFEAMSMACDASHRHHIWVSLNQLWEDVNLDPAEFVAKEDSDWLVDENKVSEGVSCNRKTVKTCSLSNTRQQGNWRLTNNKLTSPLTFSLTPSLDNQNLQEISASANDDQAELMKWHFCLSHLPFNQLKRLAKMARYQRS